MHKFHFGSHKEWSVSPLLLRIEETAETEIEQCNQLIKGSTPHEERGHAVKKLSLQKKNAEKTTKPTLFYPEIQTFSNCVNFSFMYHSAKTMMAKSGNYDRKATTQN